MSKKKRQKWHKDTLELAPDHGYRSRPGYGVFVAGRGAVRFDIPSGWSIDPRDESCVIKDPEDLCSLEITFFVTPPHDWSGQPLDKMLQESAAFGGHPVGEDGIVRVQRPDLEIVWHEYRFMEQNEKREAIGRTCLARGNDVHLILSYAVWPEDRERFEPVWEEALRTLQLGHYIVDPRVGPRLH